MDMKFSHPAHDIRHSRGAALIIALLLLIVVTLITVTAMRFSTLELRMAGNEQQRVGTFESAQAAVDAVTVHMGNFPMTGNVGYTSCNTGMASLITCNNTNITLPNTAFSTHNYVATRRESEKVPIPRGVETSSDKFTATGFSVDSRYKDSSADVGIVQGYLVLWPQSNQSN